MSNANTETEQSYHGPLNNSDLTASVWWSGYAYTWHVYVPYAEHLTDGGHAPTFAEAMRAAVAAA